jgi:hypothetical protein
MSTTSSAITDPRPARYVTDPAKRRERLFFGAISVAILVTTFAGFAPSFYLHRALGSPNVLTPGLIAHGTAFTTWVVLLVIQTSLITAQRTDLHRKLGVAGAGLGALMAVLGAYVAITRIRGGLMNLPDGSPAAGLFAVAMGTIVVFPTLLGAAVYLRRQPDFHKRLILIATIELMIAPVARLPGIAPLTFTSLGPLLYYGLSDVFLVAIAAYDLTTLKRLHPATLWGGFFLLVSQPLREIIGGTQAWAAFTHWVVS